MTIWFCKRCGMNMGGSNDGNYNYDELCESCKQQEEYDDLDDDD